MFVIQHPTHLIYLGKHHNILTVGVIKSDVTLPLLCPNLETAGFHSYNVKYRSSLHSLPGVFLINDNYHDSHVWHVAWRWWSTSHVTTSTSHVSGSVSGGGRENIISNIQNKNWKSRLNIIFILMNVLCFFGSINRGGELGLRLGFVSDFGWNILWSWCQTNDNIDGAGAGAKPSSSCTGLGFTFSTQPPATN